MRTETRPAILRVDAGGHPIHWITWQQAVELYCAERVLWGMGDPRIEILGGLRRDGARSRIVIDPVLATTGTHRGPRFRVPPLTNRLLFARDRQICLYCGHRFPVRMLTRDHVQPRCQGGPDHWENAATACWACNTHKGGRTPEQARMRLIALPYAPNEAEALILANRRILADQMAYLEKLVPTRQYRH